MNFIFSPEELTALLVLSTAASFTPGPNTTLSTALAANRGMRSALKFVLAVPIGWGLLLSLCMAGLGNLVLALPALRWVIMVSGTLYLLWMAYRLWGTREMATANADRLNISFVQGVSLQFLNIKAWMLALSLVAGWVAGKDDAMARSMLLLPIMMAFGLISNLTYAAVGSLLRQWLSEGIRLLVFNRCMATALLFTAVWMLQTSF
ncbi:MAG: Cysteine/O-acetylserine efflux protein [Pseudomonadota bacterium]|jgi:threonine/homoserine/homoserine lactone efflux protein